MKKIIFGFSLLAMSIAIQPIQAAFQGFRLGGDLGIQVFQGRTTISQGNALTDGRHRINTFSYTLGAHGGYLFELTSSKIVLGGELNFAVYGANPTIQLVIAYPGATPIAQVAIQHTTSIGGALTVGMLMNPKIMVYLNAGFETAKFKMKLTPVPAYANTFGVPQGGTFRNLFNTFSGLTLGLGGDYKMSNHFLVGFLLSHPFWRRYQLRPPVNPAFDYRPVEYRLALRLTYRF